jgi:hypothetical protein
MTISTESTRVEHTGNGSTLPFAVPFKFLDKTDLVVVLRTILTGVDAVQTLYTHYTVTGAGDASGTVTFVTAPPGTQKVVIYNDPPLTQLVDYIAGGTFPAETHEEALDRLTIQQKRTREITTRAILLPDADTDGSGAYDAKSNRIKNLGAPIATTDAATKTYTDVLVNNTALGPAPTGLIATGSVTSRLLADRWGEVANVKDFGAVGDGVTDDTAAFESCRDSCISTGKVFRVPSGTYSLPSGVDLFGVAQIKSDGHLLTGATSSEIVVGSHATTAAANNYDLFTTNGTIKCAGMERGRLKLVDAHTLYCYAQGTPTDGGGKYHAIAYSTFDFISVTKLHLSCNANGGVVAWMNENTFNCGRIISTLLLDGDYNMNNNIFYSPRMEGIDFDILKGSGNIFYNCRLEGTNNFNFAAGTFNNQLYATWSNFADTLVWGKDAATWTLTDAGDNNRIIPIHFLYTETQPLALVDVNNLDNAFKVNAGDTTKIEVVLGYKTFIDTGLVPLRDKIWFNMHVVGTASLNILLEFYDSAGAILTSEPAGATAGYPGGFAWSAANNWFHFGGALIGTASVVANPNAASTYCRLVVRTGSSVGNLLSYVKFESVQTRHNAEVISNTAKTGTITFTTGDATPTVSTGRTFITAGSTAITDFDDGVDGQIITVRAHGAITLTDSANLQLQGDANFVMAADDTVTLANVGGTNWYETGRRQVSATYAATNVSADRAYDANATTTAELADVLGTLIADLRLQGIVK